MIRRLLSALLIASFALATFGTTAQAGHRHGYYGHSGYGYTGYRKPHYRGYYPRKRYYRRHRHRDNNAAAIIGLGIGAAVLGGVIASQNNRRYVAPAPRYGYAGRPAAWSPGWYRYCAAKYRSFNPKTGYYLAYSGQYRFCN